MINLSVPPCLFSHLHIFRDEKRELHERLGMLAFFRPDNPTAHYSLNLSRQLDRVIAARLLVSSIQEGYWKSQAILANFRNVTVSGEVQWNSSNSLQQLFHHSRGTRCTPSQFNKLCIHHWAMFADDMPFFACSQS